MTHTRQSPGAWLDHACWTATRLALLGLVLPAVAGAQQLRVRVMAAGAGVPLNGALVAAVDASGQLAGEARVADDGRHRFALEAPGRYVIRVRRVGFEPHESEPIAIGAADTVDVELQVPARPVVLPAVTVREEKQCANDGEFGPRVATVWEEARKALALSEATRAGGGIELAVTGFERDLDAHGSVVSERLKPLRVGRGRPFGAQPAAMLSSLGYVRRTAASAEYFAPDERVLLSEEFARDHCFGLTAGRDSATAGMVGVRFRPVRGRRVPDVAGVFWIDSATAELRRLDFWFVNDVLPQSLQREGGAGGRIEFARLEDGAWIVGAWRMRMPSMAVQSAESRLADGVVLGFREVGGLARPARVVP